MSILENLTPVRIGQRIFPRLIKKWPWLKYVPIARRYAEGGDLESKKARQG